MFLAPFTSDDLSRAAERLARRRSSLATRLCGDCSQQSPSGRGEGGLNRTLVVGRAGSQVAPPPPALQPPAEQSGEAAEPGAAQGCRVPGGEMGAAGAGAGGLGR